MSYLESLKGGLITSCQPVDDGPMDHEAIIVAMAQAAENGGAAGLRIEGASNVAAVCKAVNIPVIGIIKRDLADSPVRITVDLADAKALIAAGVGIIAVDATHRQRPEPLEPIVQCILDAGIHVMADCATLEDAERALALGATIIGTTLSGYTAETEHLGSEPNLALIADFVKARRDRDALVMAEGRFNTPALAGSAIQAGADCVTVGSAITRLEHIVGWFDDSIKQTEKAS